MLSHEINAILNIKMLTSSSHWQLFTVYMAVWRTKMTNCSIEIDHGIYVSFGQDFNQGYFLHMLNLFLT
jgi:hypothetical protein